MATKEDQNSRKRNFCCLGMIQKFIDTFDPLLIIASIKITHLLAHHEIPINSHPINL